MRRFYPLRHDSRPSAPSLFPAGPSPHLQDLFAQRARLREEVKALERELQAEEPQGAPPSARRSPPQPRAGRAGWPGRK